MVNQIRKYNHPVDITIWDGYSGDLTMLHELAEFILHPNVMGADTTYASSSESAGKGLYSYLYMMMSEAVLKGGSVLEYVSHEGETLMMTSDSSIPASDNLGSVYAFLFYKGRRFLLSSLVERAMDSEKPVMLTEVDIRPGIVPSITLTPISSYNETNVRSLYLHEMSEAGEAHPESTVMDILNPGSEISKALTELGYEIEIIEEMTFEVLTISNPARGEFKVGSRNMKGTFKSFFVKGVNRMLFNEVTALSLKTFCQLDAVSPSINISEFQMTDQDEDDKDGEKR